MTHRDRAGLGNLLSLHPRFSNLDSGPCFPARDKAQGSVLADPCSGRRPRPY